MARVHGLAETPLRRQRFPFCIRCVASDQIDGKVLFVQKVHVDTHDEKEEEAADYDKDLHVADPVDKYVPAEAYYDHFLYREARVKRLRCHVICLVRTALVVEADPSEAVESLPKEHKNVWQQQKRGICLYFADLIWMGLDVAVQEVR